MLTTLRIGRSPGVNAVWESILMHLQAIWEADPEEVLVQVSKPDVTDAYHCSTLYPYQVGVYAYIVSLVPDDDVILVCIDLVLPMGWVDSPKIFAPSYRRSLTWQTLWLV